MMPSSSHQNLAGARGSRSVARDHHGGGDGRDHYCGSGVRDRHDHGGPNPHAVMATAQRRQLGGGLEAAAERWRQRTTADKEAGDDERWRRQRNNQPANEG